MKFSLQELFSPSPDASFQGPPLVWQPCICFIHLRHGGDRYSWREWVQHSRPNSSLLGLSSLQRAYTFFECCCSYFYRPSPSKWRGPTWTREVSMAVKTIPFCLALSIHYLLTGFHHRQQEVSAMSSGSSTSNVQNFCNYYSYSVLAFGVRNTCAFHSKLHLTTYLYK